MIIHIMSDGTVRDSVAGLVVPYDKNRIVYEIVNSMVKGENKNVKENG